VSVEPRALVVGVFAGLVLGAAAGFVAGRFVAPADHAGDAGHAVLPPAKRESESIERPENGRNDAVSSPATPERQEVPAGENAAAEVTRLRARITALEAEIARLHGLLERSDPRRRPLEELVAANDLKYGGLWDELAELLLIDAESVADDPRPLFELMVRLVDETGLALQQEEDHERTLAPEVNAPDVKLSLGFQKDDLVDAVVGVNGPSTQETVGLRVVLKLPKTTEGWKSGPLDLDIHLVVQATSRKEVGASFTATGRSFAGSSSRGVTWRGLWFREKASLHRSPRAGGEDALDGAPGDFAAERRIADDLFEKLKSRAR
jgi:uncharacterized small protein (DUF1192 family)